MMPNENGPGFYKIFLVTLIIVEMSGKRRDYIRIKWINKSIGKVKCKDNVF